MTDAERIFFEANGYLAIPDALQGEELAAVQAAAARAEAKWRADGTLPGARSAALQQVLAPIEYDPVLLDLLEHPRVFPIVRELLGRDVSMIDNDYFITPPHSGTHAGWHHDVGMEGVYHPRSTLMVKVFYLLTDASPENGCTLVLPGSHRFPADFRYPQPASAAEMPGAVAMEMRAGGAYLFNGRIYHAAAENRSDRERRVLIYNYGHSWMRIWPGYEPSERIRATASTPVRRQLLGMTDAYSSGLSDGE